MDFYHDVMPSARLQRRSAASMIGIQLSANDEGG
jgi:hypothetical protein